jgi:uncharacterized protein (DUF1800 family)
MVITHQLRNQHLVWRAGFGPMTEDVDQLKTASAQSVYAALRKSSSKSPEYINVATNPFDGLVMGVGDLARMKRSEMSAEEKKQVQKQSRQDLKSLNLAWLSEMVNSDAQLREKMALFWHGHFASRNLNIYYQQLLLDVIRRNALGSFANLLHEVSKSAAMLNFLNNNQNKKDHPNENFAREVMELFTLGRGHYTEEDVKQAARAFTGWGANPNGEFTLRRFQHDNLQKTVLGKSGNFDGDDVLDILLDQKQTARFITTKIYRYFVNDQPDDAKVESLANRFYQSHYDIADLMEAIFTSSWFFDEKNIGTRIKSPIELVAGIRRILPMQIANEEVQIVIQRILGQVLFYPPNVAGWPGGTSWIDSSTLMFRLRLPQAIKASGDLDTRPKDDDDQMMGMGQKDQDAAVAGGKGQRKSKGGGAISADIDWTSYEKVFEPVPTGELTLAIRALLLQNTTGINESTLNKYLDQSSRDELIRSATIDLMSTPEYQLC